jgi:alpha-glucosidase (family GH31 glycosyl hydrolase)
MECFFFYCIACIGCCSVWPDAVHFPDFMYPPTQQWWSTEIGKFLTNLFPVDGLWIDMNEPSNFNQTSNGMRYHMLCCILHVQHTVITYVDT